MTTCRCLLALLLLTLLTVLLGDASKPPFRGEVSAVPRGRDELLGKLSPRSKKPGGAGNGFVTRLFPGKTTPSSVRETTTTSENHSPGGDIVVRLHETVLVPDDSSANSLPIRIRITFNVSGNGNDITMTSVTLDLERNDRVRPTAPVVIGDSDGAVTPLELNYPNIFAFYYDINNYASVKVERRQRRLYYSGRFHVGRYVYRFDPVELGTDTARRRRSVAADDDDPPEYRMSSTLFEHDQHSAHDPGMRLPDARFIPYTSERSDDDGESNKRQYIVEVLAVIDHRIFQRFYTFSSMTTADKKRRDAIHTIRFYYAHVFNGVDMRYRSINDSSYSIAVQLNGYYIATDANASRFIEDNWFNGSLNGIDANPALTQFAGWLVDRRGQLPDHDQATLFTSENLIGSRKNFISGLAVIEGICSSFSVVICKDSGQYHVTQTAAHELGHNLGAGHDGIENTCSFNDQYIMAAYSIQLTEDNFRNAFVFSPCSVSEFRIFLNRLATSLRPVDKCLVSLRSPPINTSTVLGELPGRRYTPDQQCQLIYGQQSYYCGGRDEDMKLCRYMECFHPVWRFCYVHFDQRAFDGTHCANRSMCIDGSCVVRPDAPSSPSDCVYGDYRGPYSNGLSCSVIGSTALWNCYNRYYYDDCCVTCLQLRNLSAPGCEYGDHEESCARIKRAHCYNATTRRRCCTTCGRLFNASAVGCEFGDRASWCPTYVTSNIDCYNEGDTCCQSCEPHRLSIAGCEYGNRADWCTMLRPSYCYTDSYQCCQSCAHFFNQSAVGCEYGDHSDWCNVADPHQCYHNADTCCRTCSHFYTAVVGCEYGDRAAACTIQDCSKPAGNVTCCATCNQSSLSVSRPVLSSSVLTVTQTFPSQKFPSSASLPAYSLPATSSSSSSSANGWFSSWRTPSTTVTRSSSTLSTLRSHSSVASTSTLSTRPSSASSSSSSSTERTTANTRAHCPTEIQPDWCSQIKPSDCYTVPDICCDVCSRHVYDPYSTNCYYGDHYTWCSQRYCSIPSLRAACCATCKQATTTTTTPLPTTPPPVKLKCSGGDKASYCSTMPTRDCYVLASVCCDTCSAHFRHSAVGCEYGDRVGWCEQYIRSESDCRQLSVAGYCCHTCQSRYQVKCRDSVPWCNTLHHSHCYSDHIELTFCCETCKTFRTGDVAGCEYGNQYSWCDDMPKVFCKQYESFCCKTCRV